MPTVNDGDVVEFRFHQRLGRFGFADAANGISLVA